MSQNFIFFYGLFMDPGMLQNYGYHPSNPQKVKLENYELIIGKRATLKKNNIETVWGTIMSLNDKELKELYSMPSVWDYRPENVKCQCLNGDYIDAITYVLPEDYPMLAPQNEEYTIRLIEISKKLLLPLSYQQKLKSFLGK